MDFFPTEALLHWLSTHPGVAGLAVFAIAFLESLAVVGLFMPGTVLMFVVGAVIGAGALPFWPMAAWATAGAVVGDGVSFWLGRHFHQGLAERWPFRTHPQWLEGAGAFFQRHGGKSVLLGRFVGPIRPVIPAVAGMLDMPVGRFFLVNVLSGVLWAPAYLLPGVVFGASLGLAAEVATRLVLLILALTALVVLTVWAVRAAWRFMQPRAQALIQRGLAFARNHPLAGRIPAALLDPARGEVSGLVVLGLTLIGAAAVFAALLDEAGNGSELTGVDNVVYHSLQLLRTPLMDRVMVVITALGDWQVLFAVVIVLLAWLVWHRRRSAALHWLAAVAFAQLLIQAVKVITNVPRPVDVYAGASTFSFPSGHATSSMVVYGFLAVLVARELPPARRWMAYVAVAPLVILIAFSRLYLGVHWLSDVVGGLSLGLAWVALLGIAYRRHPAATLPWRGLAAAAAITLVVATAVHVPANFAADLQRYRVEPAISSMAGEAWWAEAWRSLPAARQDLRGRAAHPMNVQYAGSLDALASKLMRAGWAEPPPLDGINWLRWFGGGPIAELPLLPQVHDGHHETLLLVKPAQDGHLFALRLWDSGMRLEPDGRTLWIGTASRVVANRPFPGFALPRTAGGFTEARDVLARDLTQAGVSVRHANGVLLADGSGQLAQFDHGAQTLQPLDGVVQLQQELLLRQLDGEQFREARAHP